MMEQPTTCLPVDDMAAAFSDAESVRRTQLFPLISPIKLVVFVVNTSPTVVVANGDEATGGGNNKVVVIGDD
jgi:hypothetical protein